MALTKVRGSGIDADGQEIILDADTDTTITADTDDQIDFKTGGSDRLTIDSSGNVGIGTTSPNRALSLENGDIQIHDTGTSGDPLLNFSVGNTQGSPTQSWSLRIDNSDSDKFQLLDVTDSRIIFTVDGSGFLGIGKTSPISRLHVADGNVLFENTTTNVNSTVHHYTNSVSGGSYRVRFDSNDTVVGSIGVGTSSTAFNTSSDYRLKENVVTDWDATTRLKQLKPSRFNFILDADTTVDGFLAHEVSSIVPEAITGEKDAVDAEGNPEYQSIDQSKLVPLLTKALQEAVAKIETLEAKVTALEAK